MSSLASPAAQGPPHGSEFSLRAFAGEQACLGPQASGGAIASEGAAGTQDAVAGDEQRPILAAGLMSKILTRNMQATE
jgi:hypothetical protein